nr:hypothetical protein [Mesorhizobium sp.]
MIAEVMARLEAKAPSLTSIGAAEDLEAISRGTAPANGAAFVLPFQDRPSPNEYMTGGFSQRVEVLLLVAFVLRRADDARGAQRAGSFDLFKGEIEAALAGWAPDPEKNDEFELAAGRSASMGNGVTVYVQTWRTSRYIEEED